MSFNDSSIISSNYGVHLGTWTNWSRGAVLGATITLTRRDGNLLIAFIALFVTFVGTRFWRIACFGIHHAYSSELPHNGLYHQRQVILRNSDNAMSGLWALLAMLWTWRQHVRKPYRQIIPLLIFTLAVLGAFASAGIFSSRVSFSANQEAVNGNEVLVSSPNCGLASDTNTENMTMEEMETVTQPYMAELLSLNAVYAEQCYPSQQASASTQCQAYTKSKLSRNIDRNASCPFHEDICRSSHGNILIDSGYLDSHYDFGLNAPPEDRFLSRHLLHCAPLNYEMYQEKYYYKFEDEDKLYGEILMRYDFGKRVRHGVNYTYEYPMLPRTRDQTSANPNYNLGVLEALIDNGSVYQALSQFYPRPELWRSDGDLALIFLSANDIWFLGEVDDPWYSAHSPAGSLSGSHGILFSGDSDIYWQDAPASVLGCVTQQQLCDPRRPRPEGCTSLSGYLDTLAAIEETWPDAKHQDSVTWTYSAVGPPNLGGIISSLGVSALRSRYSMTAGIQGPLPNDQWQLEVEFWQATTMAAMQSNFVNLATGPLDEKMLKYLLRPSTDVQRRQCHNQVSPLKPGQWKDIHIYHNANSAKTALMFISQKIRSTSYTSFSVFGLSTIFILGTIIIIASYGIEPLVACIQKRRNLDVYARLEWTTNETFQLQRLAHEEINLGEWHGTCDSVPYTMLEEHLGMLDLEDLKHPRLKAPPKTFEEFVATNEDYEAYPFSDELMEGRDSVNRTGGVKSVSRDASITQALNDQENRASLGHVAEEYSDRVT